MKRLALALRIARLAATPYGRALLFLWSGASALGLPLPPLSIGIRFPGRIGRITFKTLADIWVLKDVLIDREYDRPYPGSPAVIVDLGANIGIASAYFAARYPRALVHAIEPNPRLAKQLAGNLSGFPNVRIHAWALGSADGHAPLFLGASSAASSLGARAGAPSVTVETVSLATLFARIGAEKIDVLKFDIEGAERYLFEGAPRAIGAYVGEVHYDKMPLGRDDILRALVGYAIEEYPAGRSDRALLYAYRPDVLEQKA
jgi:FkbM family methyltransferase